MYVEKIRKIVESKTVVSHEREATIELRTNKDRFCEVLAWSELVDSLLRELGVEKPKSLLCTFDRQQTRVPRGR